jgi:hypothetical protein
MRKQREKLKSVGDEYVSRAWHPGDGLQADKECGTMLAQTERAARLAQVIDGVHFNDGLQEEAQRIAA